MNEENAYELMLDMLKARTADACARVEKATEQLRIAEKVYCLRKERGLSQRALAQLVGTQASVICRIEDADYQGHSLRMLHRIAACLGHRLTVEFVPDDGAPERVVVSNEATSTYRFPQQAVRIAAPQLIVEGKQTLAIFAARKQEAITRVMAESSSVLEVVETGMQISFPAAQDMKCARDFAAA